MINVRTDAMERMQLTSGLVNCASALKHALQFTLLAHAKIGAHAVGTLSAVDARRDVPSARHGDHSDIIQATTAHRACCHICAGTTVTHGHMQRKKVAIEMEALTPCESVCRTTSGAASFECL